MTPPKLAVASIPDGVPGVQLDAVPQLPLASTFHVALATSGGATISSIAVVLRSLNRL
jgi:hypothetical protein